MAKVLMVSIAVVAFLICAVLSGLTIRNEGDKKLVRQYNMASLVITSVAAVVLVLMALFMKM
jgi:hypothetical protein